MPSNPAKGMSAVAVAVVLTACSGLTLPSTSADCSAFTPSSPDIVCVTGTVRYFGFEGGFWAVRADNDKGCACAWKREFATCSASTWLGPSLRSSTSSVSSSSRGRVRAVPA